MTIDHIGIAVHSIEDQRDLYQRLLDAEVSQPEILPNQKVKAAFVHLGSQKLELIEPLTADSPISKFLKKRGEGMHHVAYLVSNIEASMALLESRGFKLINEKPRIGAGGKLVCFLHPGTTGSVLTELVQYPEGQHLI